MSALEPVAYEPAQREAVLALMADVWGESAPPDDFDWWFERNPTGPRLISLVVDDGRVAGASAMSFLRMRLNGAETDVAFALDAATHPDYRGRGLWSALELRNEEESGRAGAPAVLGFTNPVAGPILVGKLGWRDLTRLRLWARPRIVRRGRDGVEELERFGPDVEALYREASRAWANHVVRDAGHLNWRYADSPRGYRCFVVRRRGQVEGYAVLGHKEYGGRRVGVVADLVGTRRAARTLLRRCAGESEERILVAFVSPAERATFLANGFVPTHRAIRFIGKPLQAGVELATGRHAWHFTLGDTDIF